MQEAKASEQVHEASIKSKLKVVWEYIWTLGLMALLVFSARSSLADWYEVPSGSMLPTIQLGDRIFVNKLAYDLRVPFTSISLMKLGNPERGDIVVFVYPEDNRTDYVKRLVGLPGDMVEVRNDILYVNGQPAARWEVSQDQLPAGAERDAESRLFKENLGGVEHFVFEKYGRSDEDWPQNGEPMVVGPNMYFMMGDNRDNSSDSRAWGLVPKANLRGRALRVVLSFDPNVPRWNLFDKVRWDRFLLPLNPASPS